MTAVRPSAPSRGATLRLAGILVGAAGLLQITLWFAPLGIVGVGRVAPILLAGLLGSAAVVSARGVDVEGGLVGRRGRAAFLAFAVLLVLGPVVRLATPASGSLGIMVGSSVLSGVILALSVVAAALGLAALAASRSVPRPAVVVAIVALAVHLLGGVVTSIPGFVVEVPAQELLLALYAIASVAETASLVAVGLVWFLTGRSLRG
ncbi:MULTISPECIES: hypothetical protein [unclassified Rathayibacter]|uniref:hypothetical protein n=1 Tax=unclassified Rathayibacter TaxID=2609250 RepID=UPI00070193B9|nr:MULTISPECIES: hypothetical protein [unclassified Rathayibacter]KQQ05516.1 hypothetical protein ASF42_02750 [Rathayibacter sp. Leaf294]KQS13378.1 hypothetical protein ASG06_02760 [Rathayibacter sp. Leaf185]